MMVEIKEIVVCLHVRIFYKYQNHDFKDWYEKAFIILSEKNCRAYHLLPI